MKNVMIKLVKGFVTVIVILVLGYVAVGSGMVEHAIDQVAEHFAVEEHVEGVKITTTGIEPIRVKEIHIR